MGRAFAALAAGCLLLAFARASNAQGEPSALPAASPAAEASATAPPTALPAPGPEMSPTPPAPTPAPIVADPPQVLVEIGKAAAVRIFGAAGAPSIAVADPAIASATFDASARTLTIAGLKLGPTTVTIRDDRGLTLDIPVRVAEPAGSAAAEVRLRVTGDPATAAYLRESVVDAVMRAATTRPGARALVYAAAFDLHGDLPIDNRREFDVPVLISGDGYIASSGITHVRLENFALPKTRPARLLVSDYPERLNANGVLFTATIDRSAAQRFLYYHYNPPGERERRMLVKIANTASTPAMLHVIASLAGPGTNELEVGHNATRTFLVRERRNEGTVLTIPPNTTINLINHALPAGNLVNGILQVREVSGAPLALTLIAQDADDPLDRPVDVTVLLSGGAPHARGVYPVPEFHADYTYAVDGPPLEIPIGQLPLPNLREGEALSGDYGVKQSARIVIVNSSRVRQAVALYANPRGGGATGTFLIDSTLVQAHRLTAFAKVKLWQETIAPNSYRTLRIATMPEGGSSYPLRLILGPDDGSTPPGAPGSPIY